jgi:RimJ/RimL family protein N-acetyltransferase
MTELGYWLAKPFWGKGIITETVKDGYDTGWRRQALSGKEC